ncbi:MAG TPA: TMEM165/GDT1 family protein [Burkholderiaceae bacterium]|nr:TMEM165/GDT1 family protein [Burkholderiaceae bacterium]
MSIEAFSNTAVIVAIGEMGDKTQVLALLLAARYRKPWPVAFGVLIATILSMGVTAWLGVFMSNLFSVHVLRWILVAMFFTVAAWTLMPEHEPENEQPKMKSSASLVLTAFVTFLLAEMGDKSQAATFLLAAKYHQVGWVMAGSTLGLMCSILPAILLGKTTADWLPLKWVRIVAASIFALLGCWLLIFGLGG